MKRIDTQTIGESIRQWLSEEPEVYENLLVIQAEQAVPKVLGRLSKYVRHVNCYNRVLYITMSSSTISHALALKKQEVIGKINTLIKANLVLDIVFR
ncbi:DciA family protein [Falsiporphyromonas endometrii]|uniref:DciA family protein n=1 Tax=Falsiporphyromonas endometrii TaxID=1387297 RepID=A0ABV9K9U1_9PORP|nr:DciA family protein [Porphyromonadaceae bacterium]